MSVVVGAQILPDDEFESIGLQCPGLGMDGISLQRNDAIGRLDAGDGVSVLTELTGRGLLGNKARNENKESQQQSDSFCPCRIIFITLKGSLSGREATPQVNPSQRLFEMALVWMEAGQRRLAAALLK